MIRGSPTCCGSARPQGELGPRRSSPGIPTTQEVRSGQVRARDGFEYWIVKFDGVGTFDDRALGEPRGYGRLEYAYHLMALDSGLEMNPCQLHIDGKGRAHFMTKRFDRNEGGHKIHMSDARRYGPSRLQHGRGALIRTGVCDHASAVRGSRYRAAVPAHGVQRHLQGTRTITPRTSPSSWTPAGNWSLSPAYDVIWAYNPEGDWTAQHQMTINAKRDGFVRADLVGVARRFGIRNGSGTIDEVAEAVAKWPGHAAEAGVPDDLRVRVEASHRLELGSG